MTTDELIWKIIDYGIGYDDSISVIAIPLIVALFAFAFPLLFQVMTHIESKYASENISKMFEKTRAYKWFWVTTYLSIGYVIVFGVLSLALTGNARKVLLYVVNWTSLAVAVTYSLAIIAFVRMCVRFNRPNVLLKMIGGQNRDELRNEEIQLTILKLKYLLENMQFWKSKGWKSFKDFSFRWKKVFGHYQSSEDYGKRLEDICKYAIDSRNKNLFRSVMEEVVKITESEKKKRFVSTEFSYSEFERDMPQPKPLQFYESLFEYVCLSERKSYFEDELVRHRVESLHQNRFPNENGIVSFVHDVIMAVESGHYEVYEKYIYESDFNYLFIQNLPVTVYVMGGNENDQKNAEKQRHELWQNLVDLHFLMNAYLFSRDHYKVIITVQSAKYFRHGHLYPLTPNEILAVYARIDKNLSIDGDYFRHWHLREIFGKVPSERDFLERFAAAMMLVCSEAYRMEKMCVSEEVMKQLNDSREKMLRVTKFLKHDRELVSIYPQLIECDFARTFDECLKTFEEERKVRNNNEIEQADSWSVILSGVCKWLCKEKANDKQGARIDIFNSEIQKDKRVLFEHDLKLVFCNIGWMPRGLKEDSQKGELVREELHDIYTLMNKKYICYYTHENTFHLSRHFEMVFEQRCLYMFYAAVSKMQIACKTVRVADFVKFYNRYTKGKKDDYIIIDTDCKLSVGIDVDRNGDGYKRIFLDSLNFLKDVSLAEMFRDSLLILQKEDYPSLFRKTEDAEPAVLLEDVSSREDGVAAICVSINPNLEMRYYMNTNVVKVTLVR